MLDQETLNGILSIMSGEKAVKVDVNTQDLLIVAGVIFAAVFLASFLAYLLAKKIG